MLFVGETFSGENFLTGSGLFVSLMSANLCAGGIDRMVSGVQPVKGQSAAASPVAPIDWLTILEA